MKILHLDLLALCGKTVHLAVLFTVIFYSNLVFCQEELFTYFNKKEAEWEKIELKKIQKSGIKRRELHSGYFTPNGKHPKKMVVSEVSYFDKAGNLIRTEDLSSMGELRSSVEYQYDKNSSLINAKTKKGDGSVTYEKQISYAEKDTLTIIVFDRKKNKTSQVFTYNQNMIGKKELFDETGKLYLTEFYSYADGRPIKIEYKNSVGELLSTKELTYDSLGNLTNEIVNGVKINYHLNSRNKLTRIDVGSEYYQYKYDSKNNIIDYQYYAANGKRQFRLGFSYYKNGLVKEVIRYDSDDTKAFYSLYKYFK